ncbi:MOSC domain-containing protein [Pullulanibacillus sp. KACC 23026]|uniref:MOSC domain-containing protein n=1 Tax=Pullulanibacillus sp. KACC 23026 TaxID=3028315 RepID=UPI0023B0D13B|nr:MOSC N-terminal beta barrel domain-containing protein [Pullulanibacillus sp. KACC 23026]WEG13249.1 MOSC domain-containing protein [Pullulanibacillus sp. KACC 23026]
MQLIGKIKEMNRYPVKSFKGETLDSTRIEKNGVYGDRCFAFIDETKSGWHRYITARQIPAMLSYQARLSHEGFNDPFPKLQITTPEGHFLTWNDDLLKEIQAYTKKKVSMINLKPTGSDLLAVDEASLLIVTTASLNKLEHLWGKPLDSRRFRANLVIAVENEELNENEWIGKKLKINDVTLSIDSFCERCAMVTLDPETIDRDKSLLKTINDDMNLKFGLYASVTQTGHIHKDAPVYLI